jgi:hypothetical protein
MECNRTPIFILSFHFIRVFDVHMTTALLDLPPDVIDEIVSHLDCLETPAALMCASKSLRPIALAAFRKLLRERGMGDASQLPPDTSTVPTLKRKARELRVAVSGRKSELWDRLRNEYSPTCPVPKRYRPDVVHACRSYRRKLRTKLVLDELYARGFSLLDVSGVSAIFRLRYVKRFVETGAVDDVDESLEGRVRQVVDYVFACRARRSELLDAFARNGIDPDEDFDPDVSDRYIEFGTGSITEILQNWRARGDRRNRLHTELKKRGLTLRDDSILCNEYIAYGTGNMLHIVDTMAEMAFFYTLTPYSQFCAEARSDIIREGRECGEGWVYVDRLEVSKRAKRMALAWSKGRIDRDDPRIPESLKTKINLAETPKP